MNMGPDQVAMLVGGSLLFVVALGLLIYCIVTRRSFKAVPFLFLVAIIMIGFPSITHFKMTTNSLALSGYSLGRSETLKKFHSHVLPLSGEKA
jgi:RsiW-degrading membrane proteinase PrsW (M82 family)